MVCVLVLLLIGACSRSDRHFRFATGPASTSYFDIGEVISQAVERENNIHLATISQYPGIRQLNAVENLALLYGRKVDFIITQNDVTLPKRIDSTGTEIENGIRSILPLYPQVFFIIYKKELQPKSLSALITGRNIGLGPETSGISKFAGAFFQEFGIDRQAYTPLYRSFEENVFSDTVDVVCLLTGFNNDRIKNLLNSGGKIFSPGDPVLAQAGSAIDGFCLNYPLARPYIVPRHTYAKKPDQPILTAAVDAVLLSHKEIENDVVYDIIKTIIEHKQHMASSHDNELISQFSENFLASNLRFPLHPGAKQYLERNKPTFIERWAETIALSFSMLVALIGFVSTVVTWRRRKGKNRIDKYYEKVLRLERQIPYYDSRKECINAILDLKRLRDKAFRELIKEKLIADESFRIFITLLNDIIHEIYVQEQEIDKN